MADPKADPTALLARWIDHVPADDLVVVDPPGVSEALHLASCTPKGMRFVCRDFGVHRRLDGAGLLSMFATDPPEDPGDGAIVYLPKGRARTRYTLRSLAASLPEHAPLWVVGPKRGGIASARAPLEEVAEIEGVESGKHCKLLRSFVFEPELDEGDGDAEEAWRFELGGRSLAVASYPGVFGQGRLDDGTRMLLESFTPVGARTLDVGCGAGVIGAWYALAGADVTMVDSDAFALLASRRTLEMNHVHGVRVLASDVYSSVEGEFDEIVSNPPFHKGFETDHSITQRLVSGAVEHLAPGGALTLVVNRFLPVPAQLDEHFGGFEVLAEDRRYRVYRAVLRGRAAAGPP